MGGLQQHRSTGKQACKMLALFAFVLTAMLALVLMSGCSTAGNNTGDLPSSEQAEQSGSTDGTSGSGFVIEDSAVVDVNIDEEGQ
ncbi:MAG: hypothetical protein FWD27_08375 [Coriobacteriia bacterium]|nr:hypothetical protein [Coriobacteriia bacterium]